MKIQNKEHPVAKGKFYPFILLAIGYLLSYVWYMIWDGLRHWGDGATIMPIDAKTFAWMFLPFAICIGATILALIKLKK